MGTFLLYDKVNPKLCYLLYDGQDRTVDTGYAQDINWDKGAERQKYIDVINLEIEIESIWLIIVRALAMYDLSCNHLEKSMIN